jgi:hypothetical protein
MVELGSNLAIEKARLLTLHLQPARPSSYPNQFKTGKLGECDATMAELWNAALAA